MFRPQRAPRRGVQTKLGRQSSTAISVSGRLAWLPTWVHSTNSKLQPTRYTRVWGATYGILNWIVNHITFPFRNKINSNPQLKTVLGPILNGIKVHYHQTLSTSSTWPLPQVDKVWWHGTMIPLIIEPKTVLRSSSFKNMGRKGNNENFSVRVCAEKILWCVR